MAVRLTPRDHSLLLNLREQGAALAEDLRPWFPSSSALRMRLVQLVRAGHVEVVGRHGGRRIFALGPRGKRHLDIRSNWRTRAQEALRQVAWRRCHAQLLAEGYRRVGSWHGGFALYRKASGSAVAVQVFATGPSARHIRALFKKHRPTLVRDGVVLCIFGAQAYALQRSSTRFSSFLLRAIPSSQQEIRRIGTAGGARMRRA